LIGPTDRFSYSFFTGNLINQSEGKQVMRKTTIFASATLLLFGTVGALTATAQSQDDSTAKQDIKDAGHDTKKAAKKTGTATKKTAKKATNKTAQKTDEGAQKVEDKTKPN
jgi:hypothetical protein